MVDDRSYQHSHDSYLTRLKVRHSNLTGVTSHGDVTPSGGGHRVFSHRKQRQAGIQKCGGVDSAPVIYVCRVNSVCEWRVSHKTQFPFYQFIKRAKQSKYMVIGIK